MKKFKTYFNIKINHSDGINFKEILFWQSCLLFFIVALVIVIAKFYINISLHKQIKKELFNSLKYTKYSFLNIEKPISKLCFEFPIEVFHRIEIFSIEGKLLCNNIGKSYKLIDEKIEVEIQKTLKNGKGSAIRNSKKFNAMMYFGAIKFKYRNKNYLLRRAISLNKNKKKVSTFINSILLLLIPFLILFCILSLWIISIYEKKYIYSIKKLKEELISNISHEIRTPLTAIKGYAQMILESEQKISKNQRYFLVRIEKNIEQLSNFFLDILNLSNLEKESKIQVKKIDVNEMIDNIISDICSKYSCRHINISKEVNIDFIYSDFVLLEHILINLIDNAVKYSPYEVNIVLTWNRLNKKNIFKIKDYGFGIPKDSLSRIFERFYRVDSSRSNEVEGTGIGLSIVKHAVFKLNGEINVTSEVNFGTEISICF